MQRPILTALLALSLLFNAAFAFQGANANRSVQWEYKIVRFTKGTFKDAEAQRAEKELSDLGGQGWELVSTTDETYQGTTQDRWVFFFKRARQ